MATLTSFNQVVNIIKNNSKVPCFILGSNIGEYNPNNLANPGTPQLTYFNGCDFNLAPELANISGEEINNIQEYLDSGSADYKEIYIIPLANLKEVVINFNKQWIKMTNQGIGADDDYFDYIPDMIDQYKQLIWADCEFQDNNAFKGTWNLLNNTIIKDFLKANDHNGLEEHKDKSLTAYFQKTLQEVNEDKVDHSSQYIA